MAFRTKDFISIVAGMVNWARGATTKITDFRIGSVARTMLEAPAIELDEYYQNLVRSLVDGIPSAIYQGFGFTPLPAVPATGIVTFSIPAPLANDLTIPAGTVVSTSDQSISYLTLADAVIVAGQTSVNASVSCTIAGVDGNVGSNQLVVVNGPANVTVSNQAPISNGRNAESEEGRAIRFLEFIQSLSRGPLASIEYGLTLATVANAEGVITERVVSARAFERFEIDASFPLGYVECYIWSGGGAVSAELIAEAQRIIDGFRNEDGSAVIGWKAAGVIATVASVVLREVDITATVRTRDGTLTPAQLQAVTDNVGAYIQDVPIGGRVYNAGIVAAAMRVPGVLDFRSISSNDIETGVSEKAVPGAFVITPSAAE